MNIAKEIADKCFSRRARSLGRRIARVYDDALRPVGLTSGQLTILVAITLHPGARANQLHGALDLEQSSFSRNTALMAGKGWIERRASEGERGHEFYITDKGSAALAEARVCWRSAQRNVQRMLGDDAEVFRDLVDKHVTAI